MTSTWLTQYRSEYFESILFLYYICSYFSALSGNIKPVLCNITSTTPTAEATSNKDNILSCPSPFRNILNPKGLTVKIIKPTKIEVSTVISLNNLRFSWETQSTGESLRTNTRH